MHLLSRKRIETFVKILCFLVTAAVIIPLLWIIGDVIYNGLAAWNINFLISPVIEGGIGNAILGTFIINGMACLFGIPLGVLTGMYLSEYGQESWFASMVRTMVESLSGIPSLILGLFAYATIIIALSQSATDRHYTAVASALALGLMMIPLVGKATEESMRVISNDIREAAIALGVPKWIRTTRIVLAIAKGGVLTGSLLAFARISGETAPLLFTALFSSFWPTGINQPMASLQVLIYNYALSGYPNLVTQAWGAALFLVLIVVAINIIVRVYTKPKYKEGF
jgi:phosphate transport system permease protein